LKEVMLPKELVKSESFLRGATNTSITGVNGSQRVHSIGTRGVRRADQHLKL
jgi:hypothetical protein